MDFKSHDFFLVKSFKAKIGPLGPSPALSFFRKNSQRIQLSKTSPSTGRDWSFDDVEKVIVYAFKVKAS